MKFSIEFNFNADVPPMGFLELRDESLPPNPHEYFIAPVYTQDKEGTFEVVGYSMVHRSMLPTKKQMEDREAGVNLWSKNKPKPLPWYKRLFRKGKK